ncbi:hypothetical protein FRC0259_01619 [Corynebacterium diphtheriae]|nr:hypothetical protein CIP107524_01530 [Corynebacterium diphtheriae]CAB0807365.1 hypothetical protein FRC0259_01619 [Corynebacterium diphtheriae]CAB1037348.1 hypothetical protein FRC0552_01183 [Corynebacterium diphtheriae]CAB1037670.1 hypothetical protein FRC0551_01187 [Corynebacterium diphtheriae]
MDMKKWFSQQVGTPITDQEVAEILDVTRKTANKRINGALTADDALKLSGAWKINPVLTLSELGFLTIQDVYDFFEGDGTTLAAATSAQLVKRLAEEELPLTDLVELGAAAKSKLDTMSELAARRRTPTNVTHMFENMDEDVARLGYVADDTPTEPEPGDDDYHDGP